MIIELVYNMLGSFFGTLAFSILFNVPKKFFACCGLTGMCGWLTYTCLADSVGATMAIFFGAMMVALLSRILSVWMKCPITIFMVSGIFPLVPGAGVYYTAFNLVTNDLSLAASYGILAIKEAFAIVIGLICVVSIPKKLFVWKHWKLWSKRFEHKKTTNIEQNEKEES